MKKYHVRVIGGWCGNRLLIVRDHLDEVLKKAGYECKVTHQSVWETYSLPPSVDLILQLMPAFSPSEANCPIINIKPMLLDLDHPPTIQSILSILEQNYLPERQEPPRVVEGNVF